MRGSSIIGLDEVRRGIDSAAAGVSFAFNRKKAFPVFQWSKFKPDSVYVGEGRLSGQFLSLASHVEGAYSRFSFEFGGREIGYCRVDHNAREAASVLAEILVDDEFRCCGLASIMTALAFRLELETCSRTSFAVRLTRSGRTADEVARRRTFAVAVLARQLGFSPEYNLRTLMHHLEIESVDRLAASGDAPPGYAVRLASMDVPLVAYFIDPLSGRLLPGDNRIHSTPIAAKHIEETAHRHGLVVANMNYLLRRDGVADFINSLAEEEREAETFAEQVLPVD